MFKEWRQSWRLLEPGSFDAYNNTVVPMCYGLKSLGLDKRTTLVLENTRELDRVPSTK